ncbi:MAG TPA: enoyl-CoA hydratase-related protein, partial [Candidatus Kapabacteria bacterium]|nr:enoyl-CoA hydratase-related protein [Candidatus Kapabacteria bacterium]
AIFAGKGQQVFTAIEKLGKPVIAAVNGFALAGGCELALACHIRYCSENAKFGQPEVNLGIIPGYGGTQRLTRLVGTAKSAELILSGNLIGADEARTIGLVNAVYSQEHLLEETEKFVKTIVAKAPLAVNAALECIIAVVDMTEQEGMEYEAKKFGEICGTDDFYEGTKAFLEKRPAIFQGK